MNIVCIVQARTGSTRLPGKVLKKICGKTVLEHVIDRLKRVKNINKIVIATTIKKQDDTIVEIAKKSLVGYFRGSEEDVLSRYYYAARENEAGIVIRITSDCPLIDSDVTEKTINFYLSNNYDYVSNTYVRTFPRGLDTEVFSFSLLEKAFKETTKRIYREHVTSYFWNNPQNFLIGCYKSQINYSKYRLTLDTEQDFKLIKIIYEKLYYKNNNFGLKETVNLLEENRELFKLNSKIKQKEI